MLTIMHIIIDMYFPMGFCLRRQAMGIANIGIAHDSTLVSMADPISATNNPHQLLANSAIANAGIKMKRLSAEKKAAEKIKVPTFFKKSFISITS